MLGIHGIAISNLWLGRGIWQWLLWVRVNLLILGMLTNRNLRHLLVKRRCWLYLTIWEVNDRYWLKLASLSILVIEMLFCDWTLHIDLIIILEISLYSLLCIQYLLALMSLLLFAFSFVCIKLYDVTEIAIKEDVRELHSDNDTDAVNLPVGFNAIFRSFTDIKDKVISPNNPIN